MGHPTDFIGHLDIFPALSGDEIEYLTAFSASRRFDRPGGPYAVTGSPRARRDSDHEGVDLDTYNRVARGQPGLHCHWTPCSRGCCLGFDGAEEFDEPVGWLRYLIAHFLKAGGKASKTDLEVFEQFTFDHEVEGVVAGYRRDTKQLFTIEVQANRVLVKVLRQGGPANEEWHGPLDWLMAAERWKTDGDQRRAAPPAGRSATVVQLSERRGGSRR